MDRYHTDNKEETYLIDLETADEQGILKEKKHACFLYPEPNGREYTVVRVEPGHHLGEPDTSIFTYVTKMILDHDWSTDRRSITINIRSLKSNFIRRDRRSNPTDYEHPTRRLELLCPNPDYEPGEDEPETMVTALSVVNFGLDEHPDNIHAVIDQDKIVDTRHQIKIVYNYCVNDTEVIFTSHNPNGGFTLREIFHCVCVGYNILYQLGEQCHPGIEWHSHELGDLVLHGFDLIRNDFYTLSLSS